jgi:hypothetical protein
MIRDLRRFVPCRRRRVDRRGVYPLVGEEIKSMSEGRATAQSPSPPFPPLFEPDPELIDHLEGNRFFLRLYREKW